MIGRNYTGAQRFGKDSLIQQIRDEDSELNITTVFTFLGRYIIRNEQVMIDIILGSEFVHKCFNELDSKTQQELMGTLIREIPSQIDYSVFMLVNSLSPKLTKHNYSPSYISKNILFTRDRHEYLRFYQLNDYDISLKGVEDMLNSPFIEKIDIVNILSTWKNFMSYINDAYVHWSKNEYMIDKVNLFLNVVRTELRKKKIDSLMGKNT